MKTKEELNVLKNEVEVLNTKLHELTEDEVSKVTGGMGNETPDTKNEVRGDLDIDS